MTPAEAAEILATAAAFDHRRIDEVAARAWSAALPHIDVTDARQAVVDHYGEHTDWLMPGHIKSRVRAMRRDRLAAVPTPAPDAAIADDPSAYRRQLVAGIARIADGHRAPALESTTPPRFHAPSRPDTDTAGRGAASARAALPRSPHA